MAAAQCCCACFEVFSALRPELLLPCLHSVCDLCNNDLIEGKPPKCVICDEPFSAEDVRSISFSSSNCQQKAHEDKNNVVETFCQTCQTVICTSCTGLYHFGHDLVMLDEAMTNLKQKLRQNVDSLNAQLLPIHERQKTLKDLHAMTTARTTSIFDEIQTAFAGILEENELADKIMQIEQRRNRLISEAQTILKAEIKLIETHQEVITVFKESCTEVQQRAENPFIPFTMLNSVYKRSCVLLNTYPVSSSLIINTARFHIRRPYNLQDNVNIDQIGHVYRCRDFSTITSPSLVITGGGVASEAQFYPISIAQMSGGDIVIADNKNCLLLVFSHDGIFLRQHFLKFQPYQLAVTSTDQIVVVTQSNLMLHLSSDGVVLKRTSIQSPLGIAIGAFDFHVIIGEGDMLRSVNVYGFESNGDMRWINSQLFNVHNVAIRDNEVFLPVLNWNQTTIHVLSTTDGQLIRSIQFSHANPARTVAVIPNSDCIAMCERDCVAIWTIDGQLVHRFGSSENQDPISPIEVLVLADQRIAVVRGEQQNVQIF